MGLSPVELGSIITSIVALIGVIITFAKLYLEQQKAKKDIELSKEYLQTLSRLIESHIKGQEAQYQLQRERLAWQKLEGIGKALGWIVERAEPEEEEYDI